MGFDVVVFGSLHMDIMVAAPDRPRRGETLAGQSWALKPGGKGGNQAAEAARAGTRVAFVGAVGADGFGRALLDNLGRHGVDTGYVATRAEAGSGMSVAISDPSGDYGAVIVSGANLLLGPDEAEIAASLLADGGWLALQNEIPDEANQAALQAARRRSGRTLLNAAPARTLPEDLGAWLDILVVNALEAEALGCRAVGSLEQAEQAAVQLLRLAEAVVVTAGAVGVAAGQRRGGPIRVAAQKVDIVSTHGAGDCFIGTLAARLSQGAGLEAALCDANATAALHVSRPAAPFGLHSAITV